MSFEGGCLCGAVRYRVDGEPGMVDHCHCSICRRAHGAAFGTYAAIPAGSFRWTAGDAERRRYASSEFAARHFCGVCGSPLAAEIEGEMLGVTVAGMDSPPARLEAVHMFTGSKASWYEITDDLPCYETYPPHMQP